MVKAEPQQPGAAGEGEQGSNDQPEGRRESATGSSGGGAAAAAGGDGSGGRPGRYELVLLALLEGLREALPPSDRTIVK